MELNEQQIGIIQADIDRSALKMEALKEDLLDHLCCLTESHMDKGLSFEEAYKKALSQTTPNGFDEIEKETLFLLTPQNLKTMKTFSFTTGLTSSMAMSLGFVFKVLHLPAANVLLYGGLLIFCFLFAPVWLVHALRTRQQMMSAKVFWTTGVLSGIIFTTGSMFKLWHFPGANLLMLIGCVLFAFGFLPALFFNIYRTRPQA
jgi:hypothetical protein